MGGARYARYLRSLSQAALLAILEAARWAAFGPQSPTVAFLRRNVDRSKGGTEPRMSERWQHDLSADGADPQWIARRMCDQPCPPHRLARIDRSIRYFGGYGRLLHVQRNQAEYIMAVQSVALACQNLLLAVHDLGLGASWLCAPLFVPELVREVLDLPDHWQPQAI